MPKIQWLDLPPQLRQHLFDRAKERQITMHDLFALEEWRRHSPDVPGSPWYKDFESFKLCGEGQYARRKGSLYVQCAHIALQFFK
jgi:hypothetical protein